MSETIRMVLTVIQVAVCLVLIASVLLQSGKNQGLGEIGGAAETFFGKNRARSMDAKLEKEGNTYYVDISGDKVALPAEKVTNELDKYVGKAVKAGIRPEDIKDDADFLAAHADSALTATVEVSELMGSEIYLYLDYKGNKMTARVAPTSKARNGATVKVAFDGHKVHLFDVESEQAILN